jgi:integrase
MPRRKKPARLYLREARRGDRQALWTIKHGSVEISTGCGEGELAQAQEALEDYLAKQHRPPAGEHRPRCLLAAEILTTYLDEHAAESASRDWILHTAAPIVEWWGTKTLAEVNGPNCRAYVVWRTAQCIKAYKKQPARLVSIATARHELKTLRAAINFYHAEHGLDPVPVVTLPPRAPVRADYWWTREAAAARIRAARARPETRHLARMILIGLYTGTRPGAITRLRWLPSPEGGWIDVDRGLLYRRGEGAVEGKKRQPPAPLHYKLRLHARHWKNADLAEGIASVIDFRGKPIGTKVRRAWDSVRRLAGHSRKDGPHILRHTSATWFMQTGIALAQIAGYLGMTVETLEAVYGHHHPDHLAEAAHVSLRKRTARGGSR